MEVILYIEGTNQDKDGKRTGEEKEVTHSFCNKEKYILSCRTRLGIVLMSYPWRGNSYSSSSRERRGRWCGIIIICMVPIGLYIIHRKWHTILITTSSQHHHHHEWSLHCHPYTKRINMTPSYRTINSINQLYVHAWVVGGTDGDGHEHGHDNKFTKQVGWYNKTSSLTNRPIHHYRFVIHTSTIIYNNQQQQKNKKERGKECY